MIPWRQLSQRGQVRRIRRAVQAVLPPDATLGRAIHHGENTVFALDGGGRQVLRVHRPGYHTRAAILSEHAWLGALRADGLTVPEPVRWPDGPLLRVPVPGGPDRWAARFRWITGRHDRQKRPSVALARALGHLLARLHVHADAWRPAPDFVRPRLLVVDMVGPGALWGDPRAAVDTAHRGLVADACDRLTAAAADLDADIGLVHHDLHPGNLLRVRGGVVPIDFDDSVIGYRFSDRRIARWACAEAGGAVLAGFDDAYAAVRPWRPHPPGLGELLERALTLRGLAWTHTRSDVPRLRATHAKWLPRRLAKIRGWTWPVRP